MHFLPTAGPEEATHDEDGGAPEAFKVENDYNDSVANQVEDKVHRQQAAYNYHSFVHRQERLSSCKNYRMNLHSI